MVKVFTQATESGGNLVVSVTTEEIPLFSFTIKSYSSPFLVDGGVKFLHVDNLRWHTWTAKNAEKNNKVSYSNGDPAPLILIEGGDDEITEEEIEHLYPIVRYGKRTWPMSLASVWIKRWLEKSQDLIGVDYFSHSDSTSDSLDE